jgi:hypothetical protein
MRASSCVLDTSIKLYYEFIHWYVPRHDLTRSRFIQSYYRPVLVLSPDLMFYLILDIEFWPDYGQLWPKHVATF